MVFNSLHFVAFFALVFPLTALLRNRVIPRNAMLLTASYFYGVWDWRFLSLLMQQEQWLDVPPSPAPMAGKVPRRVEGRATMAARRRQQARLAAWIELDMPDGRFPLDPQLADGLARRHAVPFIRASEVNVQLADRDFEGVYHLTAEGAERFSKALVRDRLGEILRALPPPRRAD